MGLLFPAQMTQPDVLIQVLDILKNNREFYSVDTQYRTKLSCRNLGTPLGCQTYRDTIRIQHILRSIFNVLNLW